MYFILYFLNLEIYFFHLPELLSTINTWFSLFVLELAGTLIACSLFTAGMLNIIYLYYKLAKYICI